MPSERVGRDDMAAIDADMQDDDAVGTAPPAKRRLAGKVLVLYIALPLLLLIGAGAGIYMSGIFGGAEEEPVAAKVVAPPVYYDMPDFLVNLSGPPPQHYLKMRVALQVRDKEAVALVDGAMPRILDGFQTFLRELRPEDLEGSQGMLNLREELMRRIELATQEPVVKDVLFKEIIVQ